MKKFDIPEFYRSPIIGQVKKIRKDADPRKQDFTPFSLDFGAVEIFVPRHFGFCYGVENAVEIAYRTVEQNPDKRVFLLSEMIHNPLVNDDLQSRGIRFIMNTSGEQLIPWDKINADDIVLIPAFGTTIEIEELLKNKGIETEKYDTTCPFVEKVWKTSAKLGQKDYTVIIHGKAKHEETRATFSHSKSGAPSIIVQNMEEAQKLGAFIKGEMPLTEFETMFANRYSENFDPAKDLQRVGVVNQTTMLASETQAIADYFRLLMVDKYEEANIKSHFADTRDTLCYATNDNQKATYGLLEQSADLAIVIGGYNSSNTTHLAELCEEKLPTYFINSENKIISGDTIHHFNFHTKQEETTTPFIPDKEKVRLLVTAGASCPDALVDRVIQRLVTLFDNTKPIEQVMEEVMA
ncbi:MAG TPA: 4-hydroxy-3-methylbut-2-enyl diphosphate reductase [Microscillaceae bacterium]|nr:4-hydroxy-3-methylbut-2-enyl diphosphate reductase [Microscillaceae bacterium]